MKKLALILLLLLMAPGIWAKTASEPEPGRHNPYVKHIGLKLGSAARWGEILTTQPFSEKLSANWEAFFFQVYFYDYWFEFSATYQPSLEPAASSYTSIKETYGYLVKEYDDYVEFSNIYATGYPFRMLGVNLGITFGHLHHRIKWIQADQHGGGDYAEYLKLSYHAFYVGVTYRFIERIKVGANILIPYLLEGLSYQPDDTVNYGGIEQFDQKEIVPGFSLNMEVFIIKNLSVSVEYYFMYYSFHQTNFQDINFTGGFESLGSSPGYIDHRISLAVGYGFTM